MRVLVVGAGALGGYFGGRLSEAGRDVAFLVRPARAEQIARHGLRIESQHGDADLRPSTVLADGGLDGPYDLALLAVKAPARSRGGLLWGATRIPVPASSSRAFAATAVAACNALAGVAPDVGAAGRATPR